MRSIGKASLAWTEVMVGANGESEEIRLPSFDIGLLALQRFVHHAAALNARRTKSVHGASRKTKCAKKPVGAFLGVLAA
jgi:hypothetical protein